MCWQIQIWKTVKFYINDTQYFEQCFRNVAGILQLVVTEPGSKMAQRTEKVVKLQFDDILHYSKKIIVALSETG